MAHITEQLAPFHPPPQQQLPRTPTQPSAGASLPFDILVLILSQLRDLYTEDQDSDLIFGHRGGRYAWHASLKSLATISPACQSTLLPLLPRLALTRSRPTVKEAAGSHYKAELHIVDIKHLPRNATALKEHPKRAQRLRTLTIRVFDWDYAFSGGRNSDDAGFAIPDLCGTAPNLRNLSLTSDRATTYPSSGHRNAHERFSTLTGGVSVPSVIQTSLHSLRTLIYGAPCTLADVCMFASDLPLLKHLDILGEVDHAVLPPSGFKACSPSLRRFWAPTAALTSHNLETLLTLPSTDDNSSNPSSQPHITSLAFSFDPEASATSPHPPSEDEIMDEIASLSALFAGIGEQLVELQVSTPHADLPDPRGQGGLLQHIGVVVLQNAAAFGGAAAAGGAGGAGAGAGGAGNAAGGGGNAAPAGGAPAAAAAPPPAATQPAGRQRRRAAVSAGGAAGPAGRAPAGGAAAGGGNAANPFANLGNPGGGGPLQFNFAIPAPPPPTPFFEVLIEYTPNLERLELFGRRYAADLLPFLSKMPLQNLALSVPVDTVREKVVADLLELLMGGEWKTLKRYAAFVSFFPLRSPR